MHQSSIQRRLLTEKKSKNHYHPRALGYPYSALEPHIDAETMKIHYHRHYLVYVDKLNEVMSSVAKTGRETVIELLKNFRDLPQMSDQKREDIKFNAGGVDNHNILWSIINPNNRPNRPPHRLQEAIKSEFKTIDRCKDELKEAALAIKGSGWAWLVNKKDNISVISTANQDSPRLSGYNPLIGIDMWEHAFWLKHVTDKDKYVDNFFKVLNWDSVNRHWNQ